MGTSTLEQVLDVPIRDTCHKHESSEKASANITPRRHETRPEQLTDISAPHDCDPVEYHISSAG